MPPEGHKPETAALTQQYLSFSGYLLSSWPWLVSCSLASPAWSESDFIDPGGQEVHSCNRTQWSPPSPCFIYVKVPQATPAVRCSFLSPSLSIINRSHSSAGSALGCVTHCTSLRRVHMNSTVCGASFFPSPMAPKKSTLVGSSRRVSGGTVS